MTHETHVKTSPTSSRASWLPAGILGALLTVGYLVLATRGLDRTDEGMYLNAISRPDDDVATVLLFGYVYHPVYAVLGGDIVALRWFGMIATVGLGLLTTWVLLGLPDLVGGRRLSGWARSGISLAVGSTGLFVHLALPLTPGYNSLVLQALLIVTLGLGLALFGRGRQPLVGWAVVGVGGWLVFLAKPTSAAALAVLVVLLAVATAGRRLLLSPMAVLACALAAAPLALMTPVPELVDRFRAGMETSELLGGHDRLLRWDPFFSDRAFALPALAVTLLIGLAVALVHFGAPSWLVPVPVVAALAVAAGAVWWWIRTDQTSLVVIQGPTTMIGLLLLWLLALLPRDRRPSGPGAGEGDESPAPGRPRRWAAPSFIVFVALLPAAAWIGSNNNLWMVQGRLTVFWALAGTLLLVRRSPALALAPATVATILLAAYAVPAALSPYRYPSLLSADTATQATAAGATVLLTPDDARHTHDMLALARQLGIGADTWILDLTGEAPGYIYALGGRAVGQAWTLGGYRGSTDVAVYVLKREPCVLREALVLYDPDPTAPRRLDPAVIEALGLSLDRDYDHVATFQWFRYALPARGKRPARPAHFAPVQVLRPKSGVTVTGCSIK